MAEVYTGTIRVRHDERDLFGRLKASAYLRHVAQVAVDASAAIGFDATWYAQAGTHWIVRRSRLDVHDPVMSDATFDVRTWVAEFRRVRSLRRYEVRDRAGRLRAEAVTDWVYVDAQTLKPRRLPADVEARFGARPDDAAREAFVPFGAAAPGAEAVSTEHRVLLEQLDPVGHVNNAAYVDVLVQAVFDALDRRGWPLSRLSEAGSVPTLVHVDVEYLDEARFGDLLTATSWTEAGGDGLVRHVLSRAGGQQACIRAMTRWAWSDPRTGASVPALEPAWAALGA